jgi:hypothetical protein
MSASLAGFVIVSAGYGAVFMTLAGIAAAGFALFLLAMPETRNARDRDRRTRSGSPHMLAAPAE